MTQNAWNPHRSVAAVLSTATWHESVRLVDEVSSSNRFDGRFLIEGLDGLSIGLPVNETIQRIERNVALRCVHPPCLPRANPPRTCDGSPMCCLGLWGAPLALLGGRSRGILTLSAGGLTNWRSRRTGSTHVAANAATPGAGSFHKGGPEKRGVPAGRRATGRPPRPSSHASGSPSNSLH